MCRWESSEVAVGTAVRLLQVQQQGPRAGAAALTLRLSPLLEWHLALQGPDSRLTESWLRPVSFLCSAVSMEVFPYQWPAAFC